MLRELFRAIVPGIRQRGRAAAAVASLAVAFHLGSAGAASAQAATFRLERIVVEGLERSSAQEIVRVESLLREGESYGEQELREAVYRVRRLPFVVDADMTLRRGSERGAYELVITVERARPFAYSLAMQGSQLDDPPSGEDGFDTFADTTLGVRKFVGSRGMLFASAGGGDDLDEVPRLLQVGYTHFGVIRGGYVTFGLGSDTDLEFGRDNLQLSVQTGMPLGGNHALRSGIAWGRSENELDFSPTDRTTLRHEVVQGRLEWIYDNTDDPFLPRTGLRLTSGGILSERTFEIRGESPSGFPRQDTDDWTLFAEGRRYWPLRSRQSLGLGSRLTYAEQSSRFASRQAASSLAEGIHALDLWQTGDTRELGDLRLESSVGLQYFDASSSVVGEEDGTGVVLRTSLLHRSAWGLLRFSFAYVGVSSDGR